jgi:hypothetical protein
MHGWDSAVSNVSGRRLHGLNSRPSKAGIFTLATVRKFDSRYEHGSFVNSKASRQALGPTHLAVEWVPRALSLG